MTLKMMLKVVLQQKKLQLGNRTKTLRRINQYPALLCLRKPISATASALTVCQEIQLNISEEVFDNEKMPRDSEFDIFLDDLEEPTLDIIIMRRGFQSISHGSTSQTEKQGDILCKATCYAANYDCGDELHTFAPFVDMSI